MRAAIRNRRWILEMGPPGLAADEGTGGEIWTVDRARSTAEMVGLMAPQVGSQAGGSEYGSPLDGGAQIGWQREIPLGILVRKIMRETLADLE